MIVGKQVLSFFAGTVLDVHGRQLPEISSSWSGEGIAAPWAATPVQLVWIEGAQFRPDSKYHVADMGPIWGRQDPGGPRVGPWTLLSGE